MIHNINEQLPEHCFSISGKKEDFGPCSLVCIAKHRGTVTIAKFADGVPEGTLCSSETGTGVCYQNECVVSKFIILVDKTIYELLKMLLLYKVCS